MVSRETRAVEMISKGVPQADICMALGVTAGQLSRMVKSYPVNVRKSLQKMQKADHVGMLMNLLSPGKEEALARVLKYMGKTKEQLLSDIDSGRVYVDGYGGF